MNNQSFNKARKIMLESQIRPNKVIDEIVLSAFAYIPREIFVHKSMQDIAYIDEDLPLSNGRYLMEPMVLARLIQSLELNASDNVMIIGIGTGYSVAIISQIVTSVIGIESRATLIQKAENNLTELDITNAVLFKERLQDGFSKEAPYNAILIDGGINFIPESHSDFIFSVVGEEFGLLGVGLLFFVYAIIIWRIFKIGFAAQSNFERLACSSLGFIFLLFILINVSMVIGIIPVVGVPLPLISQGGTSIVVHLLAFGVILSGVPDVWVVGVPLSTPLT